MYEPKIKRESTARPGRSINLKAIHFFAFLFVPAALATLAVDQAVAQTNVQITVNGSSGPWDIGLNPGYPYGITANGTASTNLPPCVVDASSGLGLFAGDIVTIQSLTPGQATLLAGADGTLWCDANGVIALGPLGSGTPAVYMTGEVYLEELVGVFAQNGVIVGNPFAIGNGPTTATVPAGANQLLLGVCDDWYNDNGGSVQVSVSETIMSPVIRSIMSSSNGQINLSLASVSGSTNRLWAGTNLYLPAAQWQVIANNVADTNGLFQFTDTNTAGISEKFYRLSLP